MLNVKIYSCVNSRDFRKTAQSFNGRCNHRSTSKYLKYFSQPARKPLAMKLSTVPRNPESRSADWFDPAQKNRLNTVGECLRCTEHSPTLLLPKTECLLRCDVYPLLDSESHAAELRFSAVFFSHARRPRSVTFSLIVGAIVATIARIQSDRASTNKYD